MSFCPEQFFREHRYCFFATSFLKYSPCRSTPLQLYWESQSSYGWFYATNPSPHDRITAFFHRLQRKLVAPRGKCHDKKRSTDSPYRKKRDRKIDVAPRHSRSEPVLFRKIILDGHDIACMKTEDMAKTLAVVTTERTRIANLRCKDVVAIGRAPYTNWIGRMQETDKEIVMQSLISVGMEAYANRTMDKMSDGECQRVMIARALAQDTPIILLDEPTSFLDMPNRYELVALLRRLVHDEKNVSCSRHMNLTSRCPCAIR